LQQLAALPFRRQIADLGECALRILRGPCFDHGVEIGKPLGGIGHLLGALPSLLRRDSSERCQQMCSSIRIVFERQPECAVDVELRIAQQQDFEPVASFDGIRNRTRLGDHRGQLLAVGMLGRLVDRFAMRKLG
jgi:hypothetical protein